MKNIAIFCDGSWQDFSQRNPTNVARLARCTESNGTVQQVIRYDDGVGVSQGVAEHLTHLLGGAFGAGLDYKIAAAYEFLCLNYEPGDQIYLFGFSRGAYTVRSLAGLLRQVWILKREEAGRVHEATDLYRARPSDKASPDQVEAWKAEVLHFHTLWCHQVDSAFTAEKPYDPHDPNSLVPGTPTSCAWIQYLGVWDTVGSLGIPSGLPFANTVDEQFAFHDTTLSRFVRSARQAVALDEKRETFVPALWDNVATLNVNAKATGAYGARPYQQQWFPGGHGSVGGGGASPVSFAPLLWIAEGAARAGLKLDRKQIDWFAGKVDPDADFDPERLDLGSLILKAVGSKWRHGPEDLEEVSLAARMRITRERNYAPHSLNSTLISTIKGTPPPEQPVWYAP